MDAQELRAVENFEVGTPALVCRWRLSGGTLPLENRHLRALSRRVVAEGTVSPHVIAWAKQHIEGTLKEGSSEYPDGVLMLILDKAGRAAMAVGPYKTLSERSLLGLAVRAQIAQKEAAETGCAPETLWIVKDGTFEVGADTRSISAGVESLVLDLLATRKCDVAFNKDLAAEVLSGKKVFDEAFLVSDEHGIVPADDATGARSAELRADLAKLYIATKKKKF